MIIVVVSLCVLGGIALLICCFAFGKEANASRHCSPVTFLGTTEPEQLKLRLVKRIQDKRNIEISPSTNVSLRYGMRAWRPYLSRK
jgi:hypothetical protein